MGAGDRPPSQGGTDRQLTDVVLTARAQRWGPAEALRVLLVAECEGRDRSTIESRRRRAHFPADKTFAVGGCFMTATQLSLSQLLDGNHGLPTNDLLEVPTRPSGTGHPRSVRSDPSSGSERRRASPSFDVEDATC